MIEGSGNIVHNLGLTIRTGKANLTVGGRFDSLVRAKLRRQEFRVTRRLSVAQSRCGAGGSDSRPLPAAALHSRCRRSRRSACISSRRDRSRLNVDANDRVWLVVISSASRSAVAAWGCQAAREELVPCGVSRTGRGLRQFAFFGMKGPLAEHSLAWILLMASGALRLEYERAWSGERPISNGVHGSIGRNIAAIDIVLAGKLMQNVAAFRMRNACATQSYSHLRTTRPWL